MLDDKLVQSGKTKAGLSATQLRIRSPQESETNMPKPTRDSNRDQVEHSQPIPHDQPDKQLAEGAHSTESTRYAKALSVLQVLTLTIILTAALRILVWPKPLSNEEMKFLWWALGTAATVLFASNALSRRQ